MAHVSRALVALQKIDDYTTHHIDYMLYVYIYIDILIFTTHIHVYPYDIFDLNLWSFDVAHSLARTWQGRAKQDLVQDQ